MTDNDKPITRQAIAAKERSGKLTVTGKLKVALDEMLFKASCRSDAAKAAGMTDHGLREAMNKPHVRAYYSQGLEILRTSERAKNIFALAKVRDSSDNGMAVVSAAKALEQLADVAPAVGTGPHDRPGVVIQIINAPTDRQRPGAVIDVSPNAGEDETP
jgi:hypothetical protein